MHRRIQSFCELSNIFIAIIILNCLPYAAHAMNFEEQRIDAKLVIISAEGEIRAGDSDRLMGILVALPKDEAHVLALNSLGGNIVASHSLAATIKQTGLGTLVTSKSSCLSACFIIFSSSSHKFYFPGAKVGVHSAIGGKVETPASMAMTTVMARSLADAGVPDAILGRLIRTPPGSMAWLSEADLMSMGATRLTEIQTESVSPPSSSGEQPKKVVPLAQSSAPSRAGTVPAEPSSQQFQQGLSARASWETWFSALPVGTYRDGAEYWTYERSKVRPGGCGPAASDFASGCLKAKSLLSSSDFERKTSPQFWWGWNSYVATTQNGPPIPAGMTSRRY